MLTKSLRGVNSRLNSNLLSKSIRRTKIEYTTNQPYNKRWQFKWRHAYLGSPLDREATQVRKPEDSVETPIMWFSWIEDFKTRVFPGE